jgi:hypothetical protein
VGSDPPPQSLGLKRGARAEPILPALDT